MTRRLAKKLLVQYWIRGNPWSMVDAARAKIGDGCQHDPAWERRAMRRDKRAARKDKSDNRWRHIRDMIPGRYWYPRN